jgi:hypothetical protein
MAWATIADVLAVSGQDRDQAAVDLASSIITTYAGVSEDLPEDAISIKDREHLRRATSWEAAWLTPTRMATLVTERENAKSVSADTVRIERETPADAMLAPFAQRELKSLSWVGTRSTRTLPRDPRAVAYDPMNFLNEASDPVWFGGEGAIPSGAPC